MTDNTPQPAAVDLDAIEALADAADIGPWTAHPDGLVWSTLIGEPVSGSALVENANFIAAARAAVPVMAAEIRRLRAALADDDPRHVIEFRTDGWTIKHPLSCRPKLFDCPVNRAAETELGTRRCPPAPPGRYECRAGDGDLAGMFLIAARIEELEATDG